MKSVALNNLTESLDTLTLTRDLLQKCKRCVVITGAGISVASGIPDFRSADGLFEILKHKYPKAIMSGRDLFDATLFKDPVSTQLFFHFMGEFKDVVGKAKYSRTHRFLKELDKKGKLLRCYTQNIDCLEKQAGLETDFDLSNKYFTRAVQLHGSMEYVVCTICHAQYRFTEQYQQQFKEGTAPPCPNCRELGIIRDIVGKRSKATGFLRPNIVLYNEHHPQGDHIGQLSAFDIRRNPDLLVIMGTSLKVSGIKKLVKEMAGRVHESKIGKVIYINRVPPTASEWGNIIDYHLMGDVDSAIDLLESDLKLALSKSLLSDQVSPISSTPVILPVPVEKKTQKPIVTPVKAVSKCSKKKAPEGTRQPLKAVNTNSPSVTTIKKSTPKKEETREQYVIVPRRTSPRQAAMTNSIPKIIIRKTEISVKCSTKRKSTLPTAPHKKEAAKKQKSTHKVKSKSPKTPKMRHIGESPSRVNYSKYEVNTFVDVISTALTDDHHLEGLASQSTVSNDSTAPSTPSDILELELGQFNTEDPSRHIRELASQLNPSQKIQDVLDTTLSAISLNSKQGLQYLKMMEQSMTYNGRYTRSARKQYLNDDSALSAVQ